MICSYVTGYVIPMPEVVMLSVVEGMDISEYLNNHNTSLACAVSPYERRRLCPKI